MTIFKNQGYTKGEGNEGKMEDVAAEQIEDAIKEKEAFAKKAHAHLVPNTVKNICWGLAGGIVTFVYFCFIGIVYGISIIGYKKAYACFKFAVYSLAPYGKNVASDYLSHKFGNTFWVITTGWQISFYCLILSAIFYASFFGRYLGAKWFHFAQFVLAPFGAKIRKTDLLSGNDSALVGLRDRDSEYEL